MKKTRTINVNVVLWCLQGFLALFFGLASGAPKLFLPLDMLAMPIPLPEWFVRPVGVFEVLGALGMILPGLTHIRPGLTSLASVCLALLTVCAAVYQVAANQLPSVFMALVIGLLAAVVAYGRWRLAPLRGSSRPAVLGVAT